MSRGLLSLFIGLMMAGFAICCSAQSIIAERLDLQRYEFPQEKVHVFTDRGTYLVGDTIWLRAWVVDASTHQPVNVSRFLYVDLLAPNDSLMARVKLHSTDDGVLSGYVPLDVDLPEGRYQLTAYTMFMQSVGEDYFCRQAVDVASLSSLRQRIVNRCVRHGSEVDVELRLEDAATGELLPFKQMWYFQDARQRWNDYTGKRHSPVRFTLKGKDAEMPAMLVQFDNYSKFIALPPMQAPKVTFHPEGGYLVPGVENVMTFKMHGAQAATLRGGVLLDAHGNVVDRLVVQHDGMGVVRFMPQADADYTARWTDAMEQPVDFALPRVRRDATVVQVRRDGHGTVDVHATGARADSALLVVQQRGRLLASGVGALTLSEKALPAGVVQVMGDQSNRRVPVEAESQPKEKDNKTEGKKTRAPRKKKEKEAPATAAPAAPADPLVGKPCPVCGQGTIIKGKTAYGCSRWKEGCTFRQPIEEK